MFSEEEKKQILQHIALSFEEDFSNQGDHSALAALDSDSMAEAYLLAKQSGVLAGVEVAKMVYNHFDPEVEFTVLKKDGASIEVGDRVYELKGRSRSILSAERLALNYLQRMSGIATETKKYVDEVAGTKARILDTRKKSINSALQRPP